MIDDSGKDIRLEVDGGINKDTIGLASKAGADTFVAGSAIFNTENYEQLYLNFVLRLIKYSCLLFLVFNPHASESIKVR